MLVKVKDEVNTVPLVSLVLHQHVLSVQLEVVEVAEAEQRYVRELKFFVLGGGTGRSCRDFVHF